jgi:WD40 repeat protein
MGLKPISEADNPFPGLRPFQPEEKALFFGREHESGEILNKLIRSRFVTVMGAPACGKTSLINCGVIPGISGFAEKENSPLKIISFSPGNDPVVKMENAFSQVISGNDKTDRSLISSAIGDENWIAATVKKHLAKNREKVLIIIDQFEDIFTFGFKPGDLYGNEKAAKFVALLENAVKQTDVEIYLVIVLRSDYIGECARFQGFIQLINSSSYVVPQMTAGNYRSVIEKSFDHSGTGVDPKWIMSVLDDIADQSYPLLALQQLLVRTYSEWNAGKDIERSVDISDYQSVGTIKDAISRQADEIYDALDQKEKDICRKLFKAITGKGNNNKLIRTPLSVHSINLIAECSETELFKVIEKFNSPSLLLILPGHNIPLNENTEINLSYEGLISLWGKLKDWVDEEISSVGIYKKLSEIAAMFQKGKTTLLKNPDLQLYINWRENQKPTLRWAERYDPAFERAMVYLKASEKASVEEEKFVAIRNKERIKRNRLISFVLGFAVIISLTIFAFVQKASFNRQRSEAERQNAEAAARVTFAERFAYTAGKEMAVADSNAAITAGKAEEAFRMKEIAENRSSIAERKAAEARKQQYLAVVQSDSAIKAAINANSKVRIATEEKTEAIRKRMISIGKSMSLKSLQLQGHKDLQALLAYQAFLFNKSNGGPANDADIFSGLYNVAKVYGNLNCRTFTGHEGAIKSIAFIPGKREFFTSGADGKVLKWDLDRKNQSLQVFYSGSEIINVLAVSPDAGWLACGGQNSGIKVLPVQGEKPSYELKGHTGPVKSLIFSYDGRYLYSASLDGIVLKWDLSSKTSTNISSGMMLVTAIDLSSDNKYVAGVSNEGKVQVWNPDITADNFRIESSGRVIRTVRFKPGENKLAIGYSDGYVELWDISSRKKVSELKAHSSEVNDIRFNSRLSQMATAGNDQTLKVWDMNNLAYMPVSFDENKGLSVAIEFSPDGQVVISGTSESANNLTERPVDADILASDLRTTVARNFTMDEWMAYVGKDIDYEKTKPESEFKIKIDAIK